MSSDLKEPQFCPVCGETDIGLEEDNVSVNGGYRKWYYVDCNVCESAGRVSMSAKTD